MMSKILVWIKTAILVLWFNGAAFAADVGIDIKDGTVPQFCELVFKSILKRDYVLGSGVGTSDAKVSVSVKQIDSSKVLPLVSSVLQGYGFNVDGVGPVIMVTKASGQLLLPDRMSGVVPGGVDVSSLPGPDKLEEKLDDIVKVYVPKFRSMETLQEAVKLLGVKVSIPKGGGALVVAGSEKHIDLVLDILGQLDRPNGVVDVRAVVMEYSDTSESGQSFSVALSMLGHQLGFNLAGGVPGGNSITIKGASLQAVISAIKGDSRFKQLAEPRLRVVDGSKARIQVGSSVPVRGAVSYDKIGNPIASVEYKQAGVILELTPQIMDTAIMMAVHQQVSSVAVTTSSGIDSPTMNTREVETMVDMRSGDVVLLAGLDTATDTDSVNGLPFLPDWMKGKSATHARTQVFLLLEVNRVTNI